MKSPKVNGNRAPRKKGELLIQFKRHSVKENLSFTTHKRHQGRGHKGMDVK